MQSWYFRVAADGLPLETGQFPLVRSSKTLIRIHFSKSNLSVEPKDQTRLLEQHCQNRNQQILINQNNNILTQNDLCNKFCSKKGNAK
ncbi:hypothetical protein BpHYR1_041261, partial [Brachionus plicatilis]